MLVVELRLALSSPVTVLVESLLCCVLRLS
jgi:hypothetical protein